MQSRAEAPAAPDRGERYVAKAIVRRAPAGGESDRADRGSGTLETGRKEKSGVGRQAPDPDECFVANAIARREAAGG